MCCNIAHNKTIDETTHTTMDCGTKYTTSATGTTITLPSVVTKEYVSSHFSGVNMSVCGSSDSCIEYVGVKNNITIYYSDYISKTQYENDTPLGLFSFLPQYVDVDNDACEIYIRYRR